MARDHDGNAGVILMAFIMGAITGAAAALLAAPAAGTETRQVLNERARGGREKAKVAARQGREFVQRQREHLSKAIDRGRDAYQQARESEEPKTEDQA